MGLEFSVKELLTFRIKLFKGWDKFSLKFVD